MEALRRHRPGLRLRPDRGSSVHREAHQAPPRCRDREGVLAQARGAGLHLVHHRHPGHSILWGGDIVAFLKQAKPYGLFDKTRLIWLSELDTLRVLGADMIEGVMGHTRAPFYAIKTKEIGDFIEKYRAKTKDYPSDWALQAYDCVSVFGQAAEAAKSLDREKIVDVLESGRKFKTLRGDVYFRKEDHMGSVPYYAGIVKKTPAYSFKILTDVQTFQAEQIWRPVADIEKEREKVKK
ncbi:MAG: hypothetical protein DMD81_26425 [Candidatus Rokuibacteriota bacterium]|nr:MAG: hypothetical protein DMD81_26425 [Candidatus Rokubacteria bacterium]